MQKMTESLITGFSQTDAARVETHFKKLVPHLETNQFVIVGGLAIRYHLASKGINYPIRPFNDLDLITKSANVVHPSVTEDFLVYHYHPQKRDTFYIVLVDPESKTKVDIFDYQFPPQEIVKVPFSGQLVNLPSMEDQLVKVALDIQRISEVARVDPKMFTDMRLLTQIADMKKADELWRKWNFKQHPSTIQQAIDRVEKIKNEHPEWLQKSPFRKPNPYSCPDCVQTKDFPITDMKKIYEILGHIE